MTLPVPRPSRASQPLLALGLLQLSLVALLLVACGGSEREQRQRAAAERQRQLSALVGRCRKQQPQVQRLVQDLERDSSALARLEQEGYVPVPQPAPPDPALLARFTRDDQELELERHQQALASWRQTDADARLRWQTEHNRLRQPLATSRQKAAAALARLGVADNAAARAAWSRCEAQQLAAVELP